MSPAPGQSFEVLELDGVTREFGGVTALRNLSLRIERGEFISLLGPSGCGKSTALNCIAGLLLPTSGAVRLDGREIDSVPPERRGFGMIFQSYALLPHLSVRDNVGFGLKMRRMPKKEIAPRVDRALARVQLTDLGGRRPGQLSGGQQQRVAIARALVMEPHLMLMDEPLSNLDAKLRREMRTEIAQLHSDLGLTTIYVTHDQEEALSLSSRIVVLRDGVAQQIAEPQEAFLHPANAFVADFMGYRNRFEMTLGRASGHRVLTGAGLTLITTTAGDLPDGPVEVRLRPDDLRVMDGPNQIELRCDLVEYQGKESEIVGRTPGGQPVYVRTAVDVRSGATVRLGIDPDRVLVYPGHTVGPAG